MCAALFVLFLLTPFVGDRITYAAGLSLGEADWRTGEIEINYKGATQGYTIMVYAATYDSQGAYDLIDAFTATADEGKHIVQFRNNGQTIWYYAREVNPATGEQGVRTNIQKQTPPITAYIINWPDMLRDLDKSINDALEKAMKPSPGAVNDLKDAADKLKDSIGGGQAANAGDAIKDAINEGQSGMRDPMKDDGRGTFSGGDTGGQLPNKPTTGPSLPGGSGGPGLQYPNPDSGTAIEMTIRIPYGMDMQGNLMYIQLFTQEQMDKMKWLGLARTLMVATIWLIFGFWLVQRFSPQLKS